MKWSISRKEALTGILFILPWVLGCSLFFIRSFVMSIYYSLTKYDTLSPAEWVGLKNYVDLLWHDPETWKSVLVTFKFTLINVPATLLTALFFAVLLNQKVKALSLWRTLFYLPAVIPGVASAVLWRLLFSEGGMLNKALGIFGVAPFHWLENEATVLPAFVIMNCFAAGTGIVLYLGALQGVPTNLYEAAKIDGAGRWVTFTRITLPMISPIILFNLITSIIANLQAFDQAYVMTSNNNDIQSWGNPNGATYFIFLKLYKAAFVDFQFGYAAAISWMLFAIIAVFASIIFRSSSAWVYYENMNAKGR
ncbi:sugar ABC transporter permease [Paenibacillus donghaensis]|uniref:carbohydrate ABC transporter permease n=1 Tax=Paenibacillus donghaensis TaxID=414771 RepID=UPI001883E2B5|nr:sugar ABC transporter permease [Paenibacillus donghaensis]MBE9915109.1 sugar ABC transporter permease [Paenibacillus donghaensis]